MGTRSAVGLAGVAAAAAGVAVALGQRGRMMAESTTTIDRPLEELLGLWRDRSVLEGVVGDAGEVTAVEDDGVRARLNGPLGRKVPVAGTMSFAAAAGTGTEVRLRLRVDRGGGPLAALGPGVPKGVAEEALRRFRSRAAASGAQPTGSSAQMTTS